MHAQAPAAQAPPSSASPRLKSSGAEKFPSDQVIAASGLKTGDVVTSAQIQEAADRLSALGIFSVGNFHYTAKGNGHQPGISGAGGAGLSDCFRQFPMAQCRGNCRRHSQPGRSVYGRSAGDGSIIEMMSSVIENLLAEKQSQRQRGTSAHFRGIGRWHGHAISPGRRCAAYSILRVRRRGRSGFRASEGSVPDIKGQPYSLFAVGSI